MSPSSMLRMSPSSKLLAMMPLRRTPSLLLSLLRTMMALITGGMELAGADTVLLGMSPLGILQVTMVRGIGAKAIHSQHLLQMTRRAPPSRPEPKTEASASDDTASAGRPGILKPEGGRPSASDASASAADDSFGRLPKVSFA